MTPQDETCPDRRFAFMVADLSAWDAAELIKANPEREYMLGKLYSRTPGHETEFRQDAPEPGDPVSPVIESVEISPSHMYVTFRFVDTAVYMTVPVMSTIEIGWLEAQNVG